MNARRNGWSLAISVVLGLALWLPAAPVIADEVANPDPWEPLNRKTYAVNDFADRWVLKPVAVGYSTVAPGVVQDGIGNFFENLGTPAVAINQVLQGKPRLAASDTGRFLLNSTFGIGGLIDIASRVGLPAHSEDFGQTFGRWGIDSGPYLVVPLRGPSTLRDAVGMGFDTLLNPLRLIDHERTRYSLLATSIIDTRAGLLSAEDLISGDPYVFIREAYLQRREFLITDGVVEDDPFLDDFDE